MRTLPKILKFLPSDKAKDARNFVNSLQYWLGGNQENLENLLINVAQVRARAGGGHIWVVRASTCLACMSTPPAACPDLPCPPPSSPSPTGVRPRHEGREEGGHQRAGAAPRRGHLAPVRPDHVRGPEGVPQLVSGGGEKGGGGGLREIRRHPHGVSAVQGGGLMDTSIAREGEQIVTLPPPSCPLTSGTTPART